MKKFLPKSVKNPQGFTLIELLVVVSIIAILAIIGLAIFGGVQGKARDIKRKADVDAIIKVYELKYDSLAGKYPASAAVTATDFAGGVRPTPPEGGGAAYTETVTPITQASVTVCAALEGGTNYCKSGAQAATAPASCTTSFPQSCKAQVTSGSVPATAYIACPATALDCTGNSFSPLTTGVQYWLTTPGGTAATATMSIYPISGNFNPAVTINQHQ